MKAARIGLFCFLALFVANGIGLAGDDGLRNHRFYGLHGTYAMTGTGSCIHSDPSGFTAIPNPIGYNPDGTPKWLNSVDASGTASYSATLLIEGTFEFKRNGTGTFVGLNTASVFAGGITPFPELQLRRFLLGKPETPAIVSYEIKEGGVITGTITDPANKNSVTPFSGRVSIDGRTVMLNTVNNFTIAEDGKVAATVICNVARLLMKIDD
jgi:hypothetical protein